MHGSFFGQWRKASRAARWAVAQSALAPAFCMALGATYLWFSLHPIVPGERSTLFGWKRLFEMLARSPDPLIRLPIDLTFAAGFLGAGAFLGRGIGSAFALDRWNPTFVDPSKETPVNER